MSVDLQGYRKLSSFLGIGIGAGNYINVYNTDGTTITEITSIAICNSNSSVETFKLWQVNNTIWQSAGDWDNGVNVEPLTAIKDRLFYDAEIPANQTWFLPISTILDASQYLIFEGTSNLSVTIWGKEDM